MNKTTKKGMRGGGCPKVTDMMSMFIASYCIVHRLKWMTVHRSVLQISATPVSIHHSRSAWLHAMSRFASLHASIDGHMV